MKTICIINCVILVTLFLNARQTPLWELSNDEIEARSKKFWESFEGDVIGPFQINNLEFFTIFDILLREANVKLEQHSGFRASGSFGAMYTLDIPRTFSIPVTTISNVFERVTKILDCTFDCSRGHICIEQKENHCPRINLPTNMPLAVLESSRQDYPSKRVVSTETPLDEFGAKKIMKVLKQTRNVTLTAVCCEYFLKFHDGQIVGVVTDDVKREVFGFDFGWSTNSVLDADDGSPHKLQLIYSECEDDRIFNEKLRKEIYQIVTRHCEKECKEF